MSSRARVAACLWLLAAPVASAATDTPDALTDLERRLQRMASFQANFEQRVANQFGETLQTTTGRIHLKRPGRLRWEVAAPYPQLVLADGQSLWVHDPDLAQVTVRLLAEAVAGTPAAFLTGMADDLGDAFSVARLPDEPPAGTVRYAVQPQDDGSVLREAVVTFSPHGVLSAIDLVDYLQQTTHVAFTAAEMNPELDSALFKFQVPPGADVIGRVPDSPQNPD